MIYFPIKPFHTIVLTKHYFSVALSTHSSQKTLSIYSTVMLLVGFTIYIGRRKSPTHYHMCSFCTYLLFLAVCHGAAAIASNCQCFDGVSLGFGFRPLVFFWVSLLVYKVFCILVFNNKCQQPTTDHTTSTNRK